MIFINTILQYWIDSPWYIAFLMSTVVNISVFVLTASILDNAINRLIMNWKKGSYIDDRPLKPGQKRTEIRNGIIACVIFSIGSLFTRALFSNIWPISISSLIIQIVAFTLFYESYSYFVHRLLHSRWLIKVHSVHHRSVRVTPWSAYSVHGVEAAFIGVSAPLFMLIFPFSLGVALVLHIFGMMFTILLHSNYRMNFGDFVSSHLSGHSNYHSCHHTQGNVNFGFVNSFWDVLLKTVSKR